MQAKVQSKQCSRCKEHKELNLFHKNKNRSFGVHEYCKECRKQDNPKAAERSSKNYYANKDIILSKMAAYYQDNKELKQQYGKNHYKNNRHKYLANATARKQHIKQATPIWSTEIDKWMIAEAYLLAKQRSVATGIDWDVDHIIPLRGKTVCGLHVPLNLQLLPRPDNNAKRNKFEEWSR